SFAVLTCSGYNPAMDNPGNLQLSYTMFCEDVRVEASGSLTLIGVFHQVVVPQLPVGLIKFAVLNHWQGEGHYMTEVRILTPDRKQTVAVSQPSGFEIPPNGYADNVTMFINSNFHQPGDYIVQTLINSSLYAERVLSVFLANQQNSNQSITQSEQVN
ncbi:MAG: hypothetical protein M3X11_17060, partial [Acidobacteriota bacterium]|nr:hypothetical protein [Acidobacteriota bacterium]